MTTNPHNDQKARAAFDNGYPIGAAAIERSVNATGFDVFTAAYIEAALWTSTEGEDHLDDLGFSIDDLAPETKAKIERTCAAFQQQNAAILADIDKEQAGHDLWLTRNGHGAGFWDRGYPQEIGEKLTSEAQALGEEDLYVGDDGKLYIA